MLSLLPPVIVHIASIALHFSLSCPLRIPFRSFFKREYTSIEVFVILTLRFFDVTFSGSLTWISTRQMVHKNIFTYIVKIGNVADETDQFLWMFGSSNNSNCRIKRHSHNQLVQKMVRPIFVYISVCLICLSHSMSLFQLHLQLNLKNHKSLHCCNSLWFWMVYFSNKSNKLLPNSFKLCTVKSERMPL